MFSQTPTRNAVFRKLTSTSTTTTTLATIRQYYSTTRRQQQQQQQQQHSQRLLPTSKTTLNHAPITTTTRRHKSTFGNRSLWHLMFPTKEMKIGDAIPDPYYGKYTPRRDPIPDGYWTQNPYGKPYFVGNTPQIENLMKQGREMKLYDGREHPYNPTRQTEFYEKFSLGIPGKYYGYAFFASWLYLFWDIRGRDLRDEILNGWWRWLYLSKLDRFYPTRFMPEELIAFIPKPILPPNPLSLLPAVDEAAIIEYHTPKPKEDKNKKDEKKDDDKTKDEDKKDE